MNVSVYSFYILLAHDESVIQTILINKSRQTKIHFVTKANDEMIIISV